jgi:Tol biopolymer transport system component
VDKFDRIVVGCIVFLLLAIGGVVLLGNNVGVQVESFAPEAQGRGDSAIRVRFYQDMDQESVADHFEIEPTLTGNIRWNGKREIVFEPENAMVGGQTYRVLVKNGASSEDKSAKLKEDFSFEFQVRQPRVLYMYPASAQDRNLYMEDLNSGETTQLTQAPFGLADYSVSADGKTVAYTLYNEDGTADIWLYDMATGASYQLTNCVSAFCGAPAWKPDGTQIAYERDEYDPTFGVSARRVWVVDVLTAQSTLLFEDTQVTGHSAQYSPTGNRLAMFSTNPPGILIYDFVAQNQSFVENMQGIVGEFSEDGSKLVYPILVRGAIGSTFYTHLELVDFEANKRTQVTGPSESAIEDMLGFWRPGYPTQLAVERRYLDNRYTDGPQVYLLDTETQEATPLIVDAAYNQGSLEWSPDGNMLVMQRFNRSVQGARPEIWVYSLNSEDLTLIAEDAYLPSFVP